MEIQNFKIDSKTSYIRDIAIGLGTGYTVNNLRINQIWGLPGYVYIGFLIVVGVLILYKMLSFIRFLIVKSNDNKQDDYIGGLNFNSGDMFKSMRFEGFYWEVRFDSFSGDINTKDLFNLNLT